MKLYHGTNIDFEKVDIDKSKPNKDFGLGFYSFFVTGYWYRGWFYCFADFDLCLYDKVFHVVFRLKERVVCFSVSGWW